MMKLALRHPSGLEIEFEGDVEAFNRFAKFLAGEVDGFVRGLQASREGDGDADDGPAGDNGAGGENGAKGPDVQREGSPSPMGRDGTIDPQAVLKRWARVGARSETDRVTVAAQAAVDAGLEGINSKHIDGLYETVGQPKPPRWAKAFFNAKEKGLLRGVKHGLWAPTIQGQNYARYGTKPASRGKRGSAGAQGVRELAAGGELTGG